MRRSRFGSLQAQGKVIFMNDEIIVEAGETNADFGAGVIITLSHANALALLKSLQVTEEHCGCLGGSYPFEPLIEKLVTVLAG